MNESTVQTIAVWCGAACTLGIMSVLYKENKVFRFFEHVFIGLATGFGVFIGWRDVLRPDWWDPMVVQHEWYRVFALFYALLFYTIYTRRHVWMSRLVIGIQFGLVAGLAFKGFAGMMMPQLTSSFKPVFGQTVTAVEAINNIIFLATLLCVLVYFFFSFEHRNRAVKGTANAGRYLLMIAFGATFGNTVMARFSLFIDRMVFLLQDWLHLMPK